MEKTFVYEGFHFTPFRRFTKRDGDFFAVTRRLKSNCELGLSTYFKSERRYSYDDFYRAATDKECDIFLCEETGKMYVPGENELFEYMEREHSLNARKRRYEPER